MRVAPVIASVGCEERGWHARSSSMAAKVKEDFISLKIIIEKEKGLPSGSPLLT